MSYAFLVLTILNVAAWAGAAYLAYILRAHLATILPALIDEAISRQDSRIERRLERRDNKPATPGNADDIDFSQQQDGPAIQAGRPMRRGR